MSCVYLCCYAFIVSPGYNIIFNATEYEFDVNVFSPNGTVVFEALLLLEDFSDITIVTVNFVGNADNYSINGMNTKINFFPIETLANPLLTITLNGALDPNDNTTDYIFMIEYVADSATQTIDYTSVVNVILHEIGKLYITSYMQVCNFVFST